MSAKKSFRSALTLLELLVVVAIAGVLLSLLLMGVNRVREAALRAESSNNLKQIVLAVHGHSSAHQGRLPIVGDYSHWYPLTSTSIWMHYVREPSLFVRILPHVEQDKGPKRGFQPVPVFVSPADPTPVALIKKERLSSYAANAWVFKDNPRVSSTFRDGASNTIAFAEHYGRCKGELFRYWDSSFDGHRATFAEEGDLNPTSQTGMRPIPPPKIPNVTFQAAPRVRDCHPGMPQTPHSSGMLTALADGSVRTLAPHMSPRTFWAAVTPKGGEVLGSDW